MAAVGRITAFRSCRSLSSRSLPFRFYGLSLRNYASSQYDGPSFKYILKKNDIPLDERKQIEDEVAEATKDWIQYGYSATNKFEDIAYHKITMYVFFSLLFPGLFVVMQYYPNIRNTEWAKREGYLELERRRNLKLPLVDPDLIPRNQLHLPTDEELGPDFEIII